MRPYQLAPLAVLVALIVAALFAGPFPWVTIWLVRNLVWIMLAGFVLGLVLRFITGKHERL